MILHRVLSNYSSKTSSYPLVHDPSAQRSEPLPTEQRLPTSVEVSEVGTVITIMITIVTSDWGGLAYLRLELQKKWKILAPSSVAVEQI